MSAGPYVDVTKEAARMLDGLGAAGVTARLLGGLGVAAHDHVQIPQTLQRVFADIDLVISAKSGGRASEAIAGLGYVPNARFNALHGARRLLFYDVANRRQVDVFVGSFKMCHSLQLGNVLDQHPTALSAADLLLTKLQIVQLNRKDVLDAVRLLLAHELSDPATATVEGVPSGADALAIDRVVSITRLDWGWHTTISDNLATVDSWLDQLLAAPDVVRVRQRIAVLLDAMANAPKAARWRARAALGRRVPWYELPEEVAATVRNAP